MAEPIILDANITPLKKQLKDATQELQIARQRFGDLSTEAVEAAKKVATIRDSISAANEQAALFDPGKRFQALTSAASLAAGAVGAVQGAMGLFGAESEETQKALLKVQSAMALSQGLSQLADLSKVTEELKSSFKGLTTTTAQKVAATGADTAAVVTNTLATRAQAVATGLASGATKVATTTMKIFRGVLASVFSPMGLIIGAIGLIVTNFETLKKFVLGFIPQLGQLADFFGNLVTKVTDFVGVTSQANRELEKLAKTTSRSNEDITARINLLTAQGGKEKEIFELKKKQSENELNVLRATLKTKGTLTDEEEKQFRDLKNNQLVEQAAYDKKQADELKSANEKQEQEAKSAADKARANQEQVNAKKLEAQKILSDAQNSLLTEREQQAAAIEATFQEQSKKLKEAGIADDGTLEEVRRKALAEIDIKFNDEKAEKDKAFQERLNDILTESRLAGIKDENERARAELLVQQEQKLADLATDTTLEADQKLALQKQLEIRNKQELDALDQTFAEEAAIKELEMLDEQMAKDQADFDGQKILLDEKQNLLDEFYKAGRISDDKYTAETEANSKARIEIDKLEQQAKFQNAQIAAQLLGTVSDIVGKNTAAGKATAIAATTIDTYLGAQKAYASQLIPGDPSSPIRAAIAAAIAVAGGIKNVRAIARTPVPGGGGGVSAPNIAASAPAVTSAVPTIGTSPVTALGTMMQNQPPLRAFVVESEVTNSQKRVADIERRAGF
jgi:putative Mn2+ efflux pump MntP